ncbi:1,2-phenylacetyl-CoA epoxidase subunit PaaB [Modestobacter sp. Leaf380]|uniref:1,2-phenylacetyl-CoA epoxidase subunit PaaB n=1 Tax=Modestobacter sp. Leaf380 TaxID=1736356 RepID=UPI000A4626DE
MTGPVTPSAGETTAEGGHGAVPTGPEVPSGAEPSAATARRDWPLYEVFVRGKRGLNHVHVGSLHAPDDEMAVHAARDVFTRRNEGVSIWVVQANDITASSPDEKDPMFAPAGDKVYRHPTFYEIPDDVPHI